MLKYLSILMIALMLVFVSCEDDGGTKDEVNEFEVLVEYLESGDTDHEGWVNNMSGWIKNYSDVKDNLGDYFVLDLRNENDYNSMHLAGAVNATLSNMFEKVDGTKKVLAVCYSGQTSAYAHMLLRLKGIEAYSLKFGMSIYDASLDKWSSNVDSAYSNHAAWVTTASPTLPTFDYPTLDTGKDAAEDILDARIDEAIEAWALLTTGADAIDNRSTYNIINYWGETDYLTIGHIDGAYQVTPKTLKTSENLSVFDPNGGNIFYCWTGQTAAASIAYLTVLGYNVKSIKYGANSMVYDRLPSHKWSFPWGQ
jgi:rhodanese-related sulfurtransferase